jgi:hypothetical protein
MPTFWVHRKLQILYGTILAEDFAQMIFLNIFRKLLDDNLFSSQYCLCSIAQVKLQDL